MTATLTAPAEKQRFLDAFAVRDGELSGLGSLRQSALARFDALGFPGPRNEDWQFTPLAPLLRVPFRPARRRPPVGDAPGSPELRLFADHPSLSAPARLVFVNGFFAPALSALPEGLTVGTLGGALGGPAANHLGQHASFHENAFTALNT